MQNELALEHKKSVQ